jgi:hypothetical protein
MPIGIGAAILGAGALSAGAGLLASSNATSEAGKAAAANNALESQIYQSNKALETPYITAGDSAEGELSGFLGLGGDPAATKKAFQTYLNSTGYQFDVDQGENAITSNRAAAGLLNSGATLKALDTYGIGQAQQFGQRYLSNLSGMVNTGAGAANALAGEGQNYASAVSSNNNSAATVAANAGLSAANSVSNALASGVNAFAINNGASSFGGAGNAFSALPTVFGLPIGPTT